jgi:hypothetical protein
VCATYYQNTVNDALKKKRAIKTHLFVKAAREALNEGEVPQEVVKDLAEYIDFVEMDTYTRHIYWGPKFSPQPLSRKKY